MSQQAFRSQDHDKGTAPEAALDKTEDGSTVVMNEGIVYVLKNVSMPKMAKIGKTNSETCQNSYEIIDNGINQPIGISTYVGCS